MKPDNDLKLLDAVLTDEDWASQNAQIQEAGLASLRAKRKVRARVHLALQLIAAGLLVGGTTWVAKDQLAKSQINQMVQMAPHSLSSEGDRDHSGENRRIAEPPQTVSALDRPGESPYITEEQMLKMFPKGSCLVAEINGEKQLVFLEKQ